MKFVPNNAPSYVEQGNEKAQHKDYLGAIQDYSKAIELDSKFFVAYLRRGNAKLYLKDYIGAIEDYSKIDKLQHEADCYKKGKFGDEYRYKGIEDERLYNSLGHTKIYLKDYSGAIEAYSEIYGIITFEQFMKNQFLTNNEDFGQYLEYVKFCEYNADCYFFYNRGHAKSKLKDYTGAFEDFSKAIELGLDLPNAHYKKELGNVNLNNNYQIYSITFSDSIQHIDMSAYTDYYYLKSITILNSIPPTISGVSQPDLPDSYHHEYLRHLYVPAEAVEKYLDDPFWRRFDILTIEDNHYYPSFFRDSYEDEVLDLEDNNDDDDWSYQDLCSSDELSGWGGVDFDTWHELK